VRHDLERGVHFAATDLIVVQELNGEWPARSRRKIAITLIEYQKSIQTQFDEHCKAVHSQE
jgi:hypothetical protein